MTYSIHENEGIKVARVTRMENPVTDASDFLDLMASLPSPRIVMEREMFTDDFYDLKTGIAGEILQKVSNYNIRLGIIGDFSNVASKSLKDLIRECNRTGQVLFSDSREKVIKTFSAAVS